MPEIELKYPGKFLKRLGIFAYKCILIERSKYPSGKEAGHFENEFFRKIFSILAICSSALLLLLNAIYNKIFKIKNE